MGEVWCTLLDRPSMQSACPGYRESLKTCPTTFHLVDRFYKLPCIRILDSRCSLRDHCSISAFVLARQSLYQQETGFDGFGSISAQCWNDTPTGAFFSQNLSMCMTGVLGSAKSGEGCLFPVGLVSGGCSYATMSPKTSTPTLRTRT